MSETGAPNVALVFELLELFLLGRTPNQAMGLEPIVFEFINSPDNIWHFSPDNETRKFAPGDHPNAALRIRCTQDALVRMLTQPNFQLESGDLMAFDGDPAPLTRLFGGNVTP